MDFTLMSNKFPMDFELIPLDFRQISNGYPMPSKFISNGFLMDCPGVVNDLESTGHPNELQIK